MNLKISIKDISLQDLTRLDIKCLECDFWFDNKPTTNLIEEFHTINAILDLFKSRIFERKNKDTQGRRFFCFKKSGGRIKAAFDRQKCVGIIFAGKYYLFPKVKSFSIYPPDSDSVFLGCIYVEPGYKNMGIGRRLLLDLEKDLIKEKVSSIETIGKRLSDDIDEEEYQNSPLIPIKFLIQNGFYIKKNDEFFPLVRLDLKTIEKVCEEERLPAKDVCLEKGLGSSLMVRR